MTAKKNTNIIIVHNVRIKKLLVKKQDFTS